MESFEIQNVEFCLLGRGVNIGVIEIKNPKTTIEFKENDSLFDIRLGGFKNVMCGTCGGNATDCPGHFGYIKLAFPVLNSNAIKTNLRKIIDNLCVECNRIKDCICEESRGVEGEQSSKRRKIIKSKRIKMDTREIYTSKNCGVKISFHLDGGEKISLSGLHDILSKVPEHEYRKLFPTRIRGEVDLCDFVFIHNLNVLPTSGRPPNYSNGMWRMCNTSRLYLDILKISNTLAIKKNTDPSFIVEELHMQLQNAVNVLFDSSNTTKKSNLMAVGGFRQRVDGKQGRIRTNLMGKRVEFSARTVLSGDHMLGINEVGIPQQFADDLTIPVMINRYNKDEVRKWKVRYVTKKCGQRFDVKFKRAWLGHLECGDVVERCLINGDIVVVNRQPTLHRGSMLACYVKIFPSKTIRVNYSTMITLNADTDGDELNIHVPQDLQSRAELENLFLASTNIVSSQYSAPQVGLTQDSLQGCYRLSLDLSVSRNDMMSMLYSVDIDCDLDKNIYLGIDIMGFIFKHLGIELTDIKSGSVVIKDSEVVCGVFDKKSLGVADNSIIHHIFLSYGHLKAAEFIHKMQVVAIHYLDIVGFSVSIGDCVVEHETLNSDALDEHIRKQKKMGKKVDEAKLFEATGSVIRLEPPPKQTSLNNSLLSMINAGSKGSIVNYNQITRSLGQQLVGATRIPMDFVRGQSGEHGRVLPHFEEGDDGLYAGGYIKNSFIKGLDPKEFFFHAQAGRIGIIDTAVKTASTGAQYRRLVKMLERCIVKNGHDGSRMVINSTTGCVVQFNFGEDDLDGTFIKTRK